MHRKKTKLMSDIVRLKKGIDSIKEKHVELQKKEQDFFSKVEYAKIKPYMYRRMPLSYVDTSFRYYRDYLRENTDFCLELADKKGRYYDRCLTAVCVDCGGTEEDVVLIFSEPAGVFAAKTKLSPEEGRACVGKLYHLRISSLNNNVDLGTEEGVSAEDMYLRRIVETDKMECFYKQKENYLCDYDRDICFVVLEMTPASFKLRDERYTYALPDVLSYMWRLFHNEGEGEEDAVGAFSKVEKYAHEKGYEVARFSPYDIRVIDKKGWLFVFQYEKGTFYYIEELGHESIFLADIFSPVFRDSIMTQYAKEVLDRKGIDYGGEDGEKYLSKYRKEYLRLGESDRIEYEKKCREREYFSYFEIGRQERLEMKYAEEAYLLREKLLQCSVKVPDLTQFDVSLDELTVYKGISLHGLKKIYREKMNDFEHLHDLYKDEWYYFKVAMKSGYSDDWREVNRVMYGVMSGNGEAWKHREVEATPRMWCNWLNRHPDYYSKWKGTFFDRYGALVRKVLSSERSEYILPDTLLVHYYLSKFGAKMPQENLYAPDMFTAYRCWVNDLDDDVVAFYVGYCDSVSYNEKGACLHLIEPRGDMLFEGIVAPNKEEQKALNHMCLLTYSYNYYEDEPRFMELVILPYSLTEKLGDYETDKIVVKRDVPLRGKCWEKEEEQV